MAQLYAPGSAYIFVAGHDPNVTGGQGPPYFLGTCEHKPLITVYRELEEIYEDATGQQETTDLMYQGQGGLITIALSRWNENIYQAVVTRSLPITGGVLPALAGGLGLIAFPNPNFPGTTFDIGRDKATDIGTLMVRNKVNIHLNIVFPTSLSNPYNGAGGLTGNGGAMPFGYHFHAVSLIDEDELEPSSDVAIRTMQFRATRRRDLNFNNPTALPFGGATGDWILYDHNVLNILGAMPGNLN